MNRPVSPEAPSLEEDGVMGRRSSNYPRELRERAIRIVAEVTPEYPSRCAAMQAVAQELGIGSTETLRKWIRQAEVDNGSRPSWAVRSTRRSAGSGVRLPSCAGRMRSLG